ncbi:MAG: MgtC/SapB family protein [Phycisphaerales bacterium]
MVSAQTVFPSISFDRDTPDVFLSLAIALGIGLLVGMQRERADSRLGGVRTFPLITLLGALSALLAGNFGPWVIVASLVGLIACVAIGAAFGKRKEGYSGGVTTEIAILVMYLVGALVTLPDLRAPAIAVGVVTTLLLHAKDPLHRVVRAMGEQDVRTILQFVVITFVILPVLPDRTFTDLEVLNPRHIWLMVVLVVGISLGGYLAYKLVGGAAGAVLGGLIGGAISSTATTVSYAKRAKDDPGAVATGALVLLLATCVMYVRVLVEMWVVAPGFAQTAALPVGAMLVATALLALGAWLPVRRSASRMPEQSNPSELKSALMFGLLYAFVLVAVALARRWFEDAGVYVVAAISGLTDMDAITLSTARLVDNGKVDADTGWRAVLIAAMANLVFKAGLVATLGGRALFRLIAIYFGVAFAIGAALLVIL